MAQQSEFQPSNVTAINSQNHAKGDIMKSRYREEEIMEREIYTKTEIDLKLDKINSDVKHGFEKVDLKFDQVGAEIRGGFENMGLRMEKMFSDFKLEQQKEKEENKKWLIGLAIGSFLSIIGIVVSIIAILARK
jgi:hypothetical protein